MSKPLTREVVSEAVAFGTGVLPRLTLIELAQVLGVSLRHLLRCVHANRKYFVFDSEKNVTTIKSNHEAAIFVDGNTAWKWFIENVCGGNENLAMPLSNQTELARNTNRPIRWEQQFAYVFAPHITDQAAGEGLNAKMTAMEPGLAGRMVRLGLINGTGNSPDKFFFGIIANESEIKSLRSGKLHLFLAEAAVEIMQVDSWVVVEPEKEWVKSETRYVVEAHIPATAGQAGGVTGTTGHGADYAKSPNQPAPMPTAQIPPHDPNPPAPVLARPPVPPAVPASAPIPVAVVVPPVTPGPPQSGGLNTLDQLSALLQPGPTDVKSLKQDIRKTAGAPEPVLPPPVSATAVAVAPRSAVPVVPASSNPAAPKSAVEAEALLNGLLGRIGG